MNAFFVSDFLKLSKPKKLLFLFFLLQTIVLYGQDLSYIYGKVVDSRTEEPLAFASIAEKDKSLGLISNEDGSFKIPMYFATANATMVVSFIGYYPEEIVVADLNKNNLNIIKLIEKKEVLDEIVIKNKKRKKKLSAEQIVKIAIQNIKNNYPFHDFSYVGYYRDYQKNKEKAYLNMNEAILEVYDLGFEFEDYAKTKIKLLKYKKNLEFPVDSIASKIYDNNTKIINQANLGYLSENANEFTLLRIHDAIRNYNINTYDFVNTLEKDFVFNHYFSIVKITSVNNTSLYEIKVFKDMEKFLVEGKLFISKNDFKIYKFQYGVYEKVDAVNNSIRNSYKMSVSEKFKRKIIFNTIIEYTPYNEIMYPRYISFFNSFEVLQLPKLFPTKSIIRQVKSKGISSFVIEMKFSNQVDLNLARRRRNYKITYKGKKIRAERIVVNSNKIKIYPILEDVSLYSSSLLGGEKISSADFNIDIKNLKDIDGNELYERKSDSYKQYREFFVQELNLDAKKPKDTLFMIKTRPIFEDQPVLTPKNLSKYWMNTPLKQ